MSILQNLYYFFDVDATGLDKSYSNVVVHWALIETYFVARSKKWLPKIYYRSKQFVNYNS